MKALLITVIVLFSLGVTAALAQRVPRVKGPPTISCGSYAEMRINEGPLGPNAAQIYSWVQGYLSAYYNYAKYPVVAVPEIPIIAAFLNKYCDDNPVHKVADGIDALLAERGGYK